MMIKKLLVAAMLAASVGSIATPAAADVVVHIGPPPLRVEHTPPPRHGRTWVEGHWQWKNHKHHWVEGKWIRDRPGYYYNQPTWTERDGRWHMAHGNWSRSDRDGDGVPNNRDRAPDNPYRR